MKVISFITKTLYFGIAIYAIAGAIYNSSLFYLSYFLWFVLAYFLFMMIDKENINENYKLFIVIAIWLSLIGRLYFYTNVYFYDKILHIAVPFFIILLAYEYFKKSLKPKKWVVFVFVVGILALFEMFEYLSDVFDFAPFIIQGVYDTEGNELMSPLKDTMTDLFLGSVSSIIALFAVSKKVV